MKRIMSFICAAMLVSCMSVVPVSAYEASQETCNEVYLVPEQVDENTFYYRNESGDVVAKWESIPEDGIALPCSSNGESIHWSIKKSSYKHGSYYFDTGSTDEGCTIIVSIDAAMKSTSYLGYYEPRSQKYSWLQTPSKTGFYTKLSLMGTVKLTMAIKNEGPMGNTYDGYYAES